MGDLTVAIATLDRPESLMRCLDAVLRGESTPEEVIIVDQSREDSTQTLVEEAYRNDRRIVYIRQERRGLSASRNAAIERARQPIIAFTDDDCVPDRRWLSNIEKAFAVEPRPHAVAGSVLPLGPETPGMFVVSPRGWRKRGDFKGKQVPWLVGTGGNFSVRREWFSRIGNFDERLGAGAPGRAAEDADIIYRLLGAGAYIRYQPDAIMYHERQTKAQRLESRWTYGYGIGAFCGIWLQRGDLFAARILASWLSGLLRESAGIVLHRQWAEARQRMLNVRGTASGLIYGLRVR